MGNIRELLSTSSVIVSFIVGFLAAYAVIKEIDFSKIFKNEKSIGAFVGKVILFFFIVSFVWVLLSSLFILLRIQE
ncbi:hypothetical protein [Dictyoglomus thermophilum]|uniref:Binding-protein-dependent transport systems inner membrane component, putative n=2 Tax=Dictyoglomus thermophilum TaxID=14 RepID=B5YEJ4_DICT6|nr:hypothetical protein [Dictyoglomus thermophilum]ACI18883.1 binding-protein-dependent transport systems inner membrane component, putative [Dictyoglomus thermophilum H-6-12]MCX7719787.1 ABC transporter permease [Dictyoglomus thermophilum]TYT21214.1 ABC transporter permease [Dictyoglomus thermophilum]